VQPQSSGSGATVRARAVLRVPVATTGTIAIRERCLLTTYNSRSLFSIQVFNERG